MPEFLVNINPADRCQAKRIVSELIKVGTIPKGSTVYVGADSNVAVTRPPTARVEQVFDGGSEGISTARAF